MLTDLSAYVSALSEPIRIAWITAVVAVFGSIFAGIVAMLIAWVQSRAAYRAIQVQERTIYLSLIERRATWLDGAVDTWRGWITHQEDSIQAAIEGRLLETGDIMMTVAACRREARWLFGPDVDAHMAKLAESIQTYAQARMAVRQWGLQDADKRNLEEIQQKQNDFARHLMAMMEVPYHLSECVRPYLYVGDIKVAVPSTKTSRPWWKWR